MDLRNVLIDWGVVDEYIQNFESKYWQSNLHVIFVGYDR